jgi:undecaprenyl-diphosphatase
MLADMVAKRLDYGLQLLYVVVAGLLGTGIYKFLKHKTVRPTLSSPSGDYFG